MKKVLIALLLMGGLTAQADNVMKKEKDGTYIVNTTTLAQDVEGYNGPTPVEVHIKKNMKIAKNKGAEVDGVTGATFTSDAIKENVRRGLEYYWKHK